MQLFVLLMIVLVASSTFGSTGDVKIKSKGFCETNLTAWDTPFSERSEFNTGPSLAARFTRYLEMKKATQFEQISPWLRANKMGDLWAGVFESESQRKDEIDADHPRVIMGFSQSMPIGEQPILSFAIAIGSCLQSKGSQVLEFSYFDLRSNQNTLHEVQLSADGPHVSPPNPRECLACHGQNPHLITEPYNGWPGWIFGLSRVSRDFVPYDSLEEQQIAKVERAIQANPAFSFLKWREWTGSANSLHSNVSKDSHPNAKIAELAAAANVRRVVQMFLDAFNQHPEFKLAASQCVRDEITFDQFLLNFPPEDRPKLMIRFAPEVIAKIGQEDHRSIVSRLEKLHSRIYNEGEDTDFTLERPVSPSFMLTGKRLTWVAKFFALAFELGLDYRHFSMSRHQTYNFMKGRGDGLTDTKMAIQTLIKNAGFGTEGFSDAEVSEMSIHAIGTVRASSENSPSRRQ